MKTTSDLMRNWHPSRFGRVAVLMGGTSCEREVSLRSGNAIAAACRALRLDTIALDLGTHPIAQLTAVQPDWAFNIIHGGYGEDGTLTSALELLGIRSVSSDSRAMTLAMHKQLSKSLWQQAKLPTPAWVSIDPTRLTGQTNTDKLQMCMQTIADRQLSLPLVIKPASGGSSVGLYINRTDTQLEEALLHSLDQREEILVEQLISGTEITIGIVAGTPLPVIEIQPDKGIYDYRAKYQSDRTKMVIPTSLNRQIEQHAQQLALEAFKVLGCSVWGRVDAMVKQTGEIYLLEVNSLPGMTDHSLVPYAAQSMGIDFIRLTQWLFCTAFAA